VEETVIVYGATSRASAEETVIVNSAALEAHEEVPDRRTWKLIWWPKDAAPCPAGASTGGTDTRTHGHTDMRQAEDELVGDLG
jgi:hypothetical protein